jgi:hypothetical protein
MYPLGRFCSNISRICAFRLGKPLNFIFHQHTYLNSLFCFTIVADRNLLIVD